MSTHRKGNRSGVLWRRLTVTRARRVGPLVITTPERTVVDCARCLDRPWGLAVADAALHAGLVDHAQLVAELTDAPRAEGLTKARWVVEHARSSPESPLESLGRADLLLAGRPQTEPQGWLRTARGWVRVDLLDRANRLVLEADGRIKYGEFPAVWKEKLREDDIRDLQIEVVRFTMADHHHQEPWLRRYDRALARGRLSATQLGPVPVMVPPFRLP
ncbi:hypothetical protein ACIB24_14175 [Spongisporangium articulatum]|uniref:DUF559 domain-containing protein n=1 Tax=Spongisporangium articulatum TaxID=3362603 RepID=A0ABW8ARG3_9ACTN